MKQPIPHSHGFVLRALTAGALGLVVPAYGQVINEDVKCIASDGAALDNLGYSIAVNNGTVAVGAVGDGDNGNGAGSAYLFDASTGAQLFKLLAADGAGQDSFGYSIAIDNGIVAVGARFDDDNGSNSGSVYLFNASTGVQIAKLLPNDGGASDEFGYSVAIDNGIVAVGAQRDDDTGYDSGAAYLFDATTGDQLFKLVASDGSYNERFGWSIAIDNGVVAVGAYNDVVTAGGGNGSAYLFDASTGAQLFKLLPSDPAAHDYFGWSIDISSGLVAVGAYQKDDPVTGRYSGAAYVFDAITGTQVTKLLPDDGVQYDQFGQSVAIFDGVVAVGTSLSGPNGSTSGSAYLFNASTGAQIAKLLPSDGAASDEFGCSIASDNGVVAVGARFDDDNGGNSGSAYVFAAPGAGCIADITTQGAPLGDPNYGVPDGLVTAADLSYFVNFWVAGDLTVADLTTQGAPAGDPNYGVPDGLVTAADLSFYVNLWVVGCP